MALETCQLFQNMCAVGFLVFVFFVIPCFSFLLYELTTALTRTLVLASGVVNRQFCFCMQSVSIAVNQLVLGGIL